MPPNKKKTSPKKKGAKRKGGWHSSGSPHASAAAAYAASLNFGGDRGSNERAESYAEVFAENFPPPVDYFEYDSGISEEAKRRDNDAYRDCVEHFNRGITLTNRTSDNPGPTTSRYHLAEPEFLDALDEAMRVPYVFLMTGANYDPDIDHRRLLCKILVSIALCRSRLLDGKGLIAWSKAAIAADPTYYSGYSWLSLGLMYECQWKDSLEAAKRAVASEGSAAAPRIPLRIARLERIIEAKPKSREQKAALWEVMENKRGEAVRCWQECAMPRPKKSCAGCFFGAESKCSTCRTVYYCSRACQMVHYKEHKHSCVAAAPRADANSECPNYPEPDFPEDEWMEDEYYEKFQHHADQLGLNMVQYSAHNCRVDAVKRALMAPNGMTNVNNLGQGEGQCQYPVHFAAQRNEPNAAVDIISLLLKHGACPNVIRVDGQHLLQICRGRANWIDDPDPSMANHLFRLRCQVEGSQRLEEAEREESAKLVQLVTEAIKTHARCKHCKKQKATRANFFGDGCANNMTDEMIKVFELEAADGILRND